MRVVVLVLATVVLVVGCFYDYPTRRGIISDRNEQANTEAPAAIPAANAPQPKPDIIPGLIDSNYKIKPFSRYNQEQVTQLQIGLKNKKFYYGVIDGIYGPQTKAALRRFRNYHRLTVTGDPSVAEITMLFNNQ